MLGQRKLVALVWLGATACGQGPTLPEQLVAVQTERDVYEPDQFVVVTLENRGVQSVSFHHCNYRFGLAVDRLGEGEWVEEYQRTTACVGTALGVYALEPGTVYQDSVQAEQAGSYRIRFPLADRDTFLESNTFEVATPLEP